MQAATQHEDATALTGRLREARRRAVAFVLESIGEDGPLPVGEDHWTLSVYYRLPWTLAVCGETGRAATVLGWAERNALTEDGDLAPTVRPGYEDMFAPYPLGEPRDGRVAAEPLRHRRQDRGHARDLVPGPL